MPDLGQRLKSHLRHWYGWWLRQKPGSPPVKVTGRDHVIVWNDARLHRCHIQISGANNRLEIGSGAILWGARIQLTGNNLVCRIGAHTRVRGGSFILTDAGSRFSLGEHTTMTNPMFVAQGGAAITIGRDCMIAYGSDIRCSDGHSVIDQATGATLNPAADVLIGNHVWIGIHSQILKGVSIADHAIVAARSVVTRSVASGTIVAGNPAKLIRTGVTWDRRRPGAVPAAVNLSAL
jgi:acetyltransferase-like isoleucine patch superfamily enzyme